jgi:hypothetical protein
MYDERELFRRFVNVSFLSLTLSPDDELDDSKRARSFHIVEKNAPLSLSLFLLTLLLLSLCLCAIDAKYKHRQSKRPESSRTLERTGRKSHSHRFFTRPRRSSRTRSRTYARYNRKRKSLEFAKSSLRKGTDRILTANAALERIVWWKRNIKT